MKTPRFGRRARRWASAASAAAFVLLIDAQLAVAGTVSGTGHTSSGSSSGSGGGGGTVPDLIQGGSDNLVAIVASVAVAGISIVALPRMLKDLHAGKFAGLISTIVLAGVAWYFLGDPKPAMDKLKTMVSQIAS